MEKEKQLRKQIKALRKKRNNAKTEKTKAKIKQEMVALGNELRDMLIS